jgi:hypothetical protein
MPAAPHEILVMALAERPDLLGVVAERLLGRTLPALRSVQARAIIMCSPSACSAFSKRQIWILQGSPKARRCGCSVSKRSPKGRPRGASPHFR